MDETRFDVDAKVLETIIRRAINRSFVGQASLLVLGFAFVALAAVIWRLVAAV